MHETVMSVMVNVLGESDEGESSGKDNYILHDIDEWKM